MDLYHIYNRGVQKSDIVKNDGDRIRFVRSLYVFNDTNNAPNAVSQRNTFVGLEHNRQPIVNLHAWCLMNNHYHLLISPIDDDMRNISLFMKKLNMGYAKFFNEKYNRSGYLWQGKYKKVLIKTESQLTYIPYYIHLNPLDFVSKDWRTGKIENGEKASELLMAYRWSSLRDYLGIKNFPSLIHTEYLSKALGTEDMHKKEIESLVSGNKLPDMYDVESHLE